MGQVNSVVQNSTKKDRYARNGYMFMGGKCHNFGVQLDLAQHILSSGQSTTNNSRIPIFSNMIIDYHNPNTYPDAY
jgi:hypothetical protein